MVLGYLSPRVRQVPRLAGAIPKTGTLQARWRWLFSRRSIFGQAFTSLCERQALALRIPSGTLGAFPFHSLSVFHAFPYSGLLAGSVGIWEKVSGLPRVLGPASVGVERVWSAACRRYGHSGFLNYLVVVALYIPEPPWSLRGPRRRLASLSLSTPQRRCLCHLFPVQSLRRLGVFTNVYWCDDQVDVRPLGYRRTQTPPISTKM